VLVMTRDRRCAPQRSRGFTLVELVTVVTLVGIGAALAMPSLSDAMRIQRTRAAATDLTSALLVARSEAIKRHGQVQIVPQSGVDWTTGWRVSGVTAGDQIDRKDALGEGVQVSRAPATIVYERTGRLATPGLVRLQVSDVHANARCVTIDPSGLPRQTLGACP
jgi:type IV fimbrial biogenesis protein FimT